MWKRPWVCEYAVGGGEEAGGVDCATGGGCYYSSEHDDVGVHVVVTHSGTVTFPNLFFLVCSQHRIN